MSLCCWCNGDILYAEPLNENFNSILQSALWNAIVIIEEDSTITPNPFQDTIVDTFIDADGQIGTVNTGNTTMSYYENLYQNRPCYSNLSCVTTPGFFCVCHSHWGCPFLCADWQLSLTQACTMLCTSFSCGLAVCGCMVTSFPVMPDTKYMCFNICQRVCRTGNCLAGNSNVIFGPYHCCISGMCCGTTTSSANLCYICVSQNCFNYYLNGVCLCSVCITNFPICLTSISRTIGNMNYSPPRCSVVNTYYTADVLFIGEVVSTLIEINAQTFAETKSNIFLTIKDIEENYSNLTYDVLDASDDSVLLCDGCVNQIQTLNDCACCLKVKIKAGDSALNKIKSYAYKVD